MINKVLFLVERYCDGLSEHGLSNTESMIIGAINSAFLVNQFVVCYFDLAYKELGHHVMCKELVKWCSDFKPDLVIFTPLYPSIDPSTDTIQEISKDTIVYTQIFDFSKKRIDYWLPYTTYLGIMDITSTHLHYKGNPKMIITYSPINPKDYYDKNMKRDIDISFVGTIEPRVMWQLRNEYLDYLKEKGYNPFICGGQNKYRIPTEEYSNILNRSKISLNFCAKFGGFPQLKGRVFEAMACKALVLEDDGSETKQFLGINELPSETEKFFEDGKELIIFHNRKELSEKASYYLSHDEERETIAQSGYEKVTKIYNAKNMWAYIFNRMGFTIPMALINDKNYQQHQRKMEEINKHE